MSEQILDNTFIYLVAAIVVIILAAVVIWLALRPIRLWYWKKSSEVNILRSIDKKLSLQVDATEKLRLKVQAMENNFENSKKDAEHSKDEPKCFEEKLQKEQEKQKKQEEQENVVEEIEKNDVVFSKKGTAFSEKELYDIIKF